MKNKLCDVAWNLRKAREAKNFTQEYLAVQLDISATAYRNIENRHTQVSVRRLYEIANVLDISVVELLETFGSVEAFQSGSGNIRAVCRYRTLPAVGKKTAGRTDPATGRSGAAIIEAEAR
ncbi:MAG: helix-turn-helix transcriptional regulator [Chitinophagaceae bacterium]